MKSLTNLRPLPQNNVKVVGPTLAIFEVGETFLGFTYIDKQLLFSTFCSILSPSYLSRWVGGLVVGWVYTFKPEYILPLPNEMVVHAL